MTRENTVSEEIEQLIGKLRTTSGWWSGDANARALLEQIVLERNNIARWKAEQLTVTAWWQAIEKFVRAHPEAPLGRDVSAIAIAWLKERDELRTAVRQLKSELATLPDHLAFGCEARLVILAIQSRIDQLFSP